MMDHLKFCAKSAVLYLVCAFALFGGFLQAQNTSEVLCGTWVDEAATDRDYKWVFDPDGKAFRYYVGLDTPFYECRYSIEKKWTDENGNTLYHCYWQGSLPPYAESKILWKKYLLIIIDSSGDTLDAFQSDTSYPEDIHSGLHWPIRHRR